MLIGTKCDLKDATGEVRKGLEDAGMAIGNPVTVAQGKYQGNYIKELQRKYQVLKVSSRQYY